MRIPVGKCGAEGFYEAIDSRHICTPSIASLDTRVIRDAGCSHHVSMKQWKAPNWRSSAAARPGPCALASDVVDRCPSTSYPGKQEARSVKRWLADPVSTQRETSHGFGAVISPAALFVGLQPIV